MSMCIGVYGLWTQAALILDMHLTETLSWMRFPAVQVLLLLAALA